MLTDILEATENFVDIIVIRLIKWIVIIQTSWHFLDVRVTTETKRSLSINKSIIRNIDMSD